MFWRDKNESIGSDCKYTRQKERGNVDLILKVMYEVTHVLESRPQAKLSQNVEEHLAKLIDETTYWLSMHKEDARS